MKPSLYTFLTLSGLFGLTSELTAGHFPSSPTPVIEESTAPSPFSGSLGIDFTSQYVSRGLVFENAGVIAQPSLDLSYTLLERDEGALSKLSLEMGFWSSFHSLKTDRRPGRSLGDWYEFDYTIGLGITFAKYFTLTPSFLTYVSPNGGFDRFQGVNLQLDFDDSEFLGHFALRPHFAYLRELKGKAGSGERKGNYFEVGVTPGLPELGPVSVSFPLVAGFGSGDFYADNTGFGYFSAAVDTSIALKFIPESYGQWAINAAFTYYYLNDSLARFNVPNLRSYKHNEFVWNGGISVSF